MHKIYVVFHDVYKTNSICIYVSKTVPSPSSYLRANSWVAEPEDPTPLISKFITLLTRIHSSVLTTYSSNVNIYNVFPYSSQSSKLSFNTKFSLQYSVSILVSQNLAISPFHLNLRDFIVLTIPGDVYKSRSSSLCKRPINLKVLYYG